MEQKFPKIVVVMSAIGSNVSTKMGSACFPPWGMSLFGDLKDSFVTIFRVEGGVGTTIFRSKMKTIIPYRSINIRMKSSKPAVAEQSSLSCSVKSSLTR